MYSKLLRGYHEKEKSIFYYQEGVSLYDGDKLPSEIWWIGLGEAILFWKWPSKDELLELKLLKVQFCIWDNFSAPLEIIVILTEGVLNNYAINLDLSELKRNVYFKLGDSDGSFAAQDNLNWRLWVL